MMKGRALCILTAVVLIGCDAAPATYKQPPAGSYSTSTAHVKIGGVSTSEQAASVTQDFFIAVGAHPLLGRFFIDGDHASPTTRVVVLSYGLWTERLAAAPSAIGQSIEVDARPAVIVGIAPKDFTLPESTRLWMPK
jgi:hypothetical protein